MDAEAGLLPRADWSSASKLVQSGNHILRRYWYCMLSVRASMCVSCVHVCVMVCVRESLLRVETWSFRQLTWGGTLM
jgi:hypothetical protein